VLQETVELGTDRKISLTLTEDGATVADNTVTRAQFKVAGSCFDTDTDSEISLTNNATVVELSLGAMNVNPGFYVGYLTIFDATTTNGLPWVEIEVRFKAWEKC